MFFTWDKVARQWRVPDEVVGSAKLHAQSSSAQPSGLQLTTSEALELNSEDGSQSQSYFISSQLKKKMEKKQKSQFLEYPA